MTTKPQSITITNSEGASVELSGNLSTEQLQSIINTLGGTVAPTPTPTSAQTQPNPPSPVPQPAAGTPFGARPIPADPAEAAPAFGARRLPSKRQQAKFVAGPDGTEIKILAPDGTKVDFGSWHSHIVRVLASYGIQTLDDLSNYTARQIGGLNGIGATNFKRIRSQMTLHGLGFRTAPQRSNTTKAPHRNYTMPRKNVVTAPNGKALAYHSQLKGSQVREVLGVDGPVDLTTVPVETLVEFFAGITWTTKMVNFLRHLASVNGEIVGSEFDVRLGTTPTERTGTVTSFVNKFKLRSVTQGIYIETPFTRRDEKRQFGDNEKYVTFYAMPENVRQALIQANVLPGTTAA